MSLSAPTAFATSSSSSPAFPHVPPGARGSSFAHKMASSTFSSTFSPSKRKRSTDFPDEIPETPWRLSPPTTLNTQLQLEADSSGETSPSSHKLIGQMKGMKLSEGVNGAEAAVVTDDEDSNSTSLDVEMTQSAVKRRRPSTRNSGKGEGKKDAVASGGIKKKGKGKQKLVVTISEDGERELGGAKSGGRRLRSPPPEGVALVSIETKDDDQAPEKVMKDEDVLSDDPDEYGIAYIPTPQQRALRKQRRLQQIRDYKTRESREARAQRIAHRRRRRSSTAMSTGSSSKMDNKSSSSDEGHKKVHFNI